jgi:hypothetical protein
MGELTMEDKARPAVTELIEQEFHASDRSNIRTLEDMAAHVFVLVPGINNN